MMLPVAFEVTLVSWLVRLRSVTPSILVWMTPTVSLIVNRTSIQYQRNCLSWIVPVPSDVPLAPTEPRYARKVHTGPAVTGETEHWYVDPSRIERIGWLSPKAVVLLYHGKPMIHVACASMTFWILWSVLPK